MYYFDKRLQYPVKVEKPDHQQQWLAVIEEMGAEGALPIPNSFDRSKEATEFSYKFMGTERGGDSLQSGRYCEGPRWTARERSHSLAASNLWARSRCSDPRGPTAVRRWSR